jgi:hypothetical protein
VVGKTSVWKTVSAEVLQASFNTTPEMEQLFRSKGLDSEKLTDRMVYCLC